MVGAAMCCHKKLMYMARCFVMNPARNENPARDEKSNLSRLHPARNENPARDEKSNSSSRELGSCCF